MAEERSHYRPNWDDYFMAITKIIASRATCDRLYSGAILVKDNRIISTGYNGAPAGLDHCHDVGHLMEEGHCVRTIHGEHNALLQAAIQGSTSTKGSTLYTKYSPCIHCAKYVVACGIKRIVMAKVYRNSSAIDYLKSAGVQLDVYEENPLWNEELMKIFSEGIVERQNEGKIIFSDKHEAEPQQNNNSEIYKSAAAQNKNIVLAVVGLPGAGKSEITNYIIEKTNWPKVYFGQPTFDELQKRGMPVNEQNERQIREELREKYGMAAFAILNIPQINELYNNSSVILESLYSWEEYLEIKKIFGDKFLTLAVYASPQTRAERLAKRPERPLNSDEVQSRDFSQISNLHQAGPIARADFTIYNEGTLDQAYAQVDKFLNSFVK